MVPGAGDARVNMFDKSCAVIKFPSREETVNRELSP